VSGRPAGRVVALVDDLMDRSRLGVIDGLAFTRDPAACADSQVVLVDLARHAAAIPAIIRTAPHARIVAFGSHVDTDALDEAARAGATVVLARSQFLRDPAAVVASLLDD
jgi:DNA-binding NarL/FixJ family response regulator